MIPNIEQLLGFSWRIAAAAALVFFSYNYLMRLISMIDRKLMALLPPERVPLSEARRVLMIPLWGISVILVYIMLSPWLKINLFDLFLSDFRPSYFVEGLFLGIGEAAVSLIMASYALRILAPLRSRQIGNEVLLEFRMLGQTGWMRSYRDAFNIIPMPWSYLVVMWALLGEELIFRAILVSLFLPYSPAVAIIISTMFFMAVQKTRLPWYQAVAPIVGALVMGLVNAYLFALTPNLIPLTIAHVAFLGFFMGPASPVASEEAVWGYEANVRWSSLRAGAARVNRPCHRDT